MNRKLIGWIPYNASKDDVDESALIGPDDERTALIAGWEWKEAWLDVGQAPIAEGESHD